MFVIFQDSLSQILDILLCRGVPLALLSGIAPVTCARAHPRLLPYEAKGHMWPSQFMSFQKRCLGIGVFLDGSKETLLLTLN